MDILDLFWIILRKKFHYFVYRLARKSGIIT